MLGRTADQLYWMARYMERAESMARILDVSSRMALMPGEPDARHSVWTSALEIAGATDTFEERANEASRRNVIEHLAFDRQNASSIWSSIQAARENGRALRGTITTEMWESLNATWLELEDMSIDDLGDGKHRDFFDWVKERSHLFRGVIDGTLIVDDSHYFIDLGTAIERADNTARLLDGKYHVVLSSAEDVGGAVDYYQWGAVLRSVSAFRAYHRIYSNVVTPIGVAELLVLRHDMPRSLHACLDSITASLDNLCGGRNYECRRLAGENHARLHYGKMSEIFDAGLHEFLTEFIERHAAFSYQMQRDFMMIG